MLFPLDSAHILSVSVSVSVSGSVNEPLVQFNNVALD